jgi:hypothetical protein
MRASRAWLASLLLVPLAGCQAADEPAPGKPPQRSEAPAGMDESLRDAALELVEARETALRSGDRAAFLDTVDPDELGFSATQARWFDNLALLPVGDVSYELGDESAMTQVSGDGDLQLPVDFTMRLRGFDRRPVTQRMVWTFVRSGDRALLANDRNLQIDAKTGWTPAPWDLAHVDVRRSGAPALRRSGGILAVFDEGTIAHADYVMGDMTVEDTAGVAFPVLAHEGGPVAAYRFLVNPNVVDDVVSRDFVFRHELVHVALGTSDDRSPVWLAEGAAEYVSRSVLPVDQRRLISATQLAATAGRTLEATRRFYTRDPSVSYALAALVCDYLATTRGEEVLWDLVRTFRTARFSSWAQSEDVVRRELGLSTEELSTQALAWARSG